VTEELLDLTQVRAGARELRGEDVPQRVWGDALALVDATRVDVVAEDLTELGVVEPVPLDADEDGLLGQRDPRRSVLGEERCKRRVDWDRPLPAALRLPDPQ
jgi:hypothetical protein